MLFLALDQESSGVFGYRKDRKIGKKDQKVEFLHIHKVRKKTVGSPKNAQVGS